MAGLAMGRTEQAERIHRELSSVGHLFIPVFFLDRHQHRPPGHVPAVGAGLPAHCWSWRSSASSPPTGAVGTKADKLLIGVGMILREVGLIFASLGLVNGALNDDLTRSILVVLASRRSAAAAEGAPTRSPQTEAVRPRATERPPAAGCATTAEDPAVRLPPDSEALSPPSRPPAKRPTHALGRAVGLVRRAPLHALEWTATPPPTSSAC